MVAKRSRVGDLRPVELNRRHDGRQPDLSLQLGMIFNVKAYSAFLALDELRVVSRACFGPRLNIPLRFKYVDDAGLQPEHRGAALEADRINPRHRPVAVGL